MQHHTNFSIWFFKQLILFCVSICLLAPSFAQVNANNSSLPSDHFSARYLAAKQKKVESLQVKDVQIDEALKELSSVFELGIMFNPDIIPTRRVSLKLKNVTIDEALQAVLQDTDLEGFVSESGNITLQKRNSQKNSTQVTIAGQVTDANGDPLPGVNIILRVLPLEP